jgi:hypothetical protein
MANKRKKVKKKIKEFDIALGRFKKSDISGGGILSFGPRGDGAQEAFERDFNDMEAHENDDDYEWGRLLKNEHIKYI